MIRTRFLFVKTAVLLFALPTMLVSVASAATVTVSSITEVESSWSSSYDNPINPLSSYGPVAAWTFQTIGGGAGGKLASGMVVDSDNGVNTANVQYAWNLVWTPSNPSDTPNSPTITVQQRYKYNTHGLASSMPLNLPALVYSAFIDTGGLPDLNPQANGSSNQTFTVSQTTWVNGSYVTIRGVTWTLQSNGTYTATVPFPDSYITEGGGNVGSIYTNAKSLQLAYGFSYTIQTTLISVGSYTFTPFNGLP